MSEIAANEDKALLRTREESPVVESNSDAKRRRLLAKEPDTWVCFHHPPPRIEMPFHHSCTNTLPTVGS